MPKKRTRRARHRYSESMPDYVAWWIENGEYLNPKGCRESGFADPDAAAWGLFVLDSAHEPPTVVSHVWTRQKLRDAGYDVEVDKIEAKERAERDID